MPAAPISSGQIKQDGRMVASDGVRGKTRIALRSRQTPRPSRRSELQRSIAIALILTPSTRAGSSFPSSLGSPLSPSSKKKYHAGSNQGTSYFKNDEVTKMTTKNRLRLLLLALFAFIAAP